MPKGLAYFSYLCIFPDSFSWKCQLVCCAYSLWLWLTQPTRSYPNGFKSGLRGLRAMLTTETIGASTWSEQTDKVCGTKTKSQVLSVWEICFNCYNERIYLYIPIMQRLKKGPLRKKIIQFLVIIGNVYKVV